MTRVALISVLLVAVACGKHDTSATNSGSASAATAAVTPRAAAFWKWFAANAATLHAEPDLRGVMEKINVELAKVDDGVFAEIGVDGDARTLVLTADGKRRLFPVVQELYAARPTVPGWSIVAFRQRAKPGQPPMRIELGRTKVSPDDVKLVGKPNGNKLDIDVYIPGFTTTDQMGEIGFLLLDHVLGEYDMETRIGVVEFHAIGKAPASARPLPELPALVDALK